ncbi:translational GTPase TypA [Patescibacteria group bacterium]
MNIRNIAIVAHVDHGKTTLVDGMLKQTHTFRDNQAEMSQTTILDSNDLEREKGITILAKNTSVVYKDTKINIIDTPGHADFSGEIERVINMADGALLIVDAAEGPLPQTKFVLQKALDNNLKLVVIINKIDRSDARPKEVLHQIEELFLHMADSEDHLNFPVLYSVGRDGKSWKSLPESFDETATLESVFETIVGAVPPPSGNEDAPFKMLVSTLDFDSHKGKIALGKITQGTITSKQPVVRLEENNILSKNIIDEVFTSEGLNRVSVEEGKTGDIVALTGVPDIEIGQTLSDPSDPTGFPKIQLEEPTLKILVSANTSPFSGREGEFVTQTQIADRLKKELQTNIGLRLEENKDGQGFLISGRGELHLAVLLETMRRQGYEMQVGKPEVIFRVIDGAKHEPYEELTIEIGSSFVGIITQELGSRHAEIIDTFTNDKQVTRMVYKVSTRNLLGFRGDILTKTRGNGIFTSRILGYYPTTPPISKLRNGVLVSFETGKVTAYSLTNAQKRGKTFVGPTTPVYEGMIVGINSRREDMDINVCKTKNLTNMRAASADITVQLDPPVEFTLEQCLDFIEADELLEITPRSLRLRKRHLTKIDRARSERTD